MYAIFHSKHNVCNFLLWGEEEEEEEGHGKV
jgi:hypothetical protein